MGRCYICGVELMGIRPCRFKKNPRRRCMSCYRKTVKGKHKHGDGYIVLRWGRKKYRQYEHRAVMEGVLGRKLKKVEVVHHKNGDRGDNRPENLCVYKNAGAHVLLEGHVSRGKDGKFKKKKEGEIHGN